MAATASPLRFISQSDAGCARAPVFILWTYAFHGDALRRMTDNDQLRPSCHCGRNLPLAGANFLLKRAPPPMATISLYTTAPSLAQADGILDTHINILPFSPDLLQTPEPSPLRTSLHSWPPHLILDATPQTVLQRQNTLRALILSHLLPSTRRLTGLSDGMQVTPYRQRLRFVLALGGLSECAKSPLGARVDTHPIPLVRLGAGPPRSSRTCSTRPRRRSGSGSTSTPSQAHVLVQHIEDHAKAHFWVAVLSLELVHRLGAIVKAKRVVGDLVQVVCVEVAEAERIRRQVERVGRGEVEGKEEEKVVQKKMQELRDKDVVKRERGTECVKGIADLVLDNSGGLEEAWAELEGFVVARMNA
ncbi:hypothetical protein B0H14DRAFT_3479287 [Mycena olivaceomarginata]|nr:hypothetical protein B0H14DRAFT_3479287 [Mycena olivaceomarginata]